MSSNEKIYKQVPFPHFMQPNDDPFAPNRRVLIVDDDALVRTFFLESLKADGYIPKAFESGKEGIAILQQFSPAVAIVDYQMHGGMNGLEFLAQSRTIAPLTRVVFVTGHGNEQIAIGALTGGASEYLKKPVTLPDLTPAVERASIKYEDQIQQEFDARLQRFFASGWRHYGNNIRSVAEGNVELMGLRLIKPNASLGEIKKGFPSLQAGVQALSSYVREFGTALSGGQNYFEVSVAGVYAQARRSE